MSNSLQEIRQAIETGDVDQARQKLRTALQNEPTADVYFLASQVAVTEQQRNNFLEDALGLDPFHIEAQKALIKDNSAEIEQSTSPKTEEHDSLAPGATPEVSSPSLPDSVQKEEDAVYIRGTINRQTDLYLLPHELSDVRTQVPVQVPVLVLSRTRKGEWINIVYQSSLGQPVSGWIKMLAVTSLQVNGKPVNAMDLPITEHELDRKEDIQILLARLNNRALLFVMLGLASSAFAVGGLIAVLNGAFIGLLPLFFGAVALVAFFILARSYNVGYWNKVRRSKQGTGENMKEDLLKVAMVAGGALLGASALKRGHQRNMARINSQREYTIRHK